MQGLRTDMNDDLKAHAREHQFEEVSPVRQASPHHAVLDDLKEVRLSVTAELGTCTMRVREVLDLKRGSVVPLSKMAGEMTDILVNGLPLARGEVVVIGDALHVRIGEVIGATEREEKAEEAGDGR